MNFLTSRLGIVSLLGITVIGCFGFGVHHLGWLARLHLSGLDHEQGWEVAAILWTAVAANYYFNNQPTSVGRIRTVAYLLCLGAILAFVTLWTVTADAASTKQPLHLVLVTGIAVILVVVDVVLGKWDALVADVPMLIAFVVLIAFVFCHANESENPGTLISGAITFQLIVSSVLFVGIEAGLLKRIAGWPQNGTR